MVEYLIPTDPAEQDKAIRQFVDEQLSQAQIDAFARRLSAAVNAQKRDREGAYNAVAPEVVRGAADL